MWTCLLYTSKTYFCSCFQKWETPQELHTDNLRIFEVRFYVFGLSVWLHYLFLRKNHLNKYSNTLRQVWFQDLMHGLEDRQTCLLYTS